MAALRRPFQGVTNIIRFNWHFYVLAAFAVVVALFLTIMLPRVYVWIGYILVLLPVAAIIISLAVSCYIYDLSGLYDMNWLEPLGMTAGTVTININAGLDETSHLIANRYPATQLKVYDFYDPQRHTEVSIRRARKAYPAYQGTQHIATDAIPLPNDFADNILLTLAAHEIREDNERILFFNELRRILRPGGKIMVTEHLRDIPNFLAYNFGYFHFLSKNTWHHTFKEAGLSIIAENKMTAFVTNFILQKRGSTS